MNLARRYGYSLIFGLIMGLVLISNATAKNESENNQLPLDQLRNFSDIFSRIKSDYVEEVEDTELLKHAIKGMLSGLDPHSSYLDPDEYEELQIGTTGEFGGLGIQVGMEDGFVKVISPIDDTPAYHAGIKSGDLIIRIDQKPVKGMTLNNAVDIMRGKPGTKISLLILREGKNEPLTFVLERAIIKVKSVKSHILQQNFGYVRISTFQSRTAHHLIEAIDTMVEDNEQSLKGLVLDLRNNPGGVLNAAAEVSDLFLNKGLIVFTKGRIKNSYFEYRAKPGDTLDGAPIVVLINGGSASASEIVAGALQDHKRAILMGSKTFGKGSVQTIQELRNGGAVKMTTARYYTPAGRSIQAQGIVPDIALEELQLTAIDHNGIQQIKESDLSGHLENPNGKPATNKSLATKAITDDYAIREALNLLKGLQIYQKSN
ncbi:MAG: S41 family peptidase [Gammaproteobacteria bacterium]